MNINEHLAVNVMGWEKYKCGPRDCIMGVWYAEHIQQTWKLRYEIKGWNPTENQEQALMCLDGLAWYQLNKTSLGFTADVGNNNKIQIAPTLPMAISLACAKATGWKE